MILATEASALVRALKSYWPQPDLDTAGTTMYAQALVATGIEADLIAAAVKQLQVTWKSPFRPGIPDIVEAVRAVIRDDRQAPRAALPAGSQRLPSKRETYALMANAVGAAVRGRESFEARLGRSVRSTESGTMRHISTAFAIGPVTITGRSAEGMELAAELLARHDAMERT